VTACAGAVRLVLGALTPLFPDETYYWEWSRHLADGYYDHPPVIAWLIRLGTLVAGDTPFGVRLATVVLGTVGIMVVCATARRLGGHRAALLAAMIFAVMPLSAAGLILATPDAPLLVAASATIYALLRALESARAHISFAWWCAAGVLLGLAFSSKYTSALLPLGVLAAFVVRRDLREQLKRPGPYISVALAVAVFAPVILWNAQHDWVSFAFQLQHGLGGARGSILNRELELIGGQLGLVTPILFALGVVAVRQSFRTPSSSASQPVLGVIAAVVFAFFMYSATRRRVEANWPALAYIPVVLLLVSHRGGRAWNRWMQGGIGFAALITFVTYANSFVPVLPVSARRDPAARAAGWDHLARSVDRISSVRRARSSHRTFVAAERYQEASELAFLLPGHPETFSLNLSGRSNQYNLWPTFPDRARSEDTMILVVDDVVGIHPTTAMLAPHFATITRREVVSLTRHGDLVKNLRIWLLDGWRGTWPQRPLRSRT
jgi:4-amino-4-deoxy-L-arabinose transferase-like glycosyltransferase